jgi:nitrite reductase (NO-forming)
MSAGFPQRKLSTLFLLCVLSCSVSSATWGQQAVKPIEKPAMTAQEGSPMSQAKAGQEDKSSDQDLPFNAETLQVPEQGSELPAVDIVRDPADLPGPVGDRPPQLVRVTLTAQELEGKLDPAPATTYEYWTFGGKVPGPMIRVRQGDTVELTLKNDGHRVAHSIDLHAVLGPGGGMGVSEGKPGETKTFTFKAELPGVYVYHCGTDLAAQHIANGMYGLIVVEPTGGLPHVDHEFYVMQGEVYTQGEIGDRGHQRMSLTKLMIERPEYLTFNGAADALTKNHPMRAKTGETVRIFFGVGGPNLISSPHVIGQVLDRVYAEGSFASPPLINVQTTLVPPGGATVLEFKPRVPGSYKLVDHALIRLTRGLVGALEVSGEEQPELFHAGPAR